MDASNIKFYELKDQIPRDITPHDFITMQKNYELKIQSDWYDIEKQHGNNSVLKGPLSLHVCFFFKSEKTLKSKNIDFLVRYIFVITKNIIHSDDASITSIQATKRLSSLK